MKILCLADRESPYLWDYYRPERLSGVDFIISCGDLKAEYLSFLTTMGGIPVLYVPGNHDGGYEQRPPEGCECIDGRLVTVKGVRVLGLGGCPVYSYGPYQYTERQMNLRLIRAGIQVRRAGGVDILVTHAPPKGCGDGADYAHRGSGALRSFMDRVKPPYLVHGHIHMNYGMDIKRTARHSGTMVVNAYERYMLEI